MALKKYTVHMIHDKSNIIHGEFQAQLKIIANSEKEEFTNQFF